MGPAMNASVRKWSDGQSLRSAGLGLEARLPLFTRLALRAVALRRLSSDSTGRMHQLNPIADEQRGLDP
jgi:hypothetical protein